MRQSLIQNYIQQKNQKSLSIDRGSFAFIVILNLFIKKNRPVQPVTNSLYIDF